MKEILLNDILVLVDRAVASTCIVAPLKWGCAYTHKQVMESVNRLMQIVGNIKLEVKEKEGKEE